MDKQIKCYYDCKEVQDYVEQFKVIRGGGKRTAFEREINSKSRKVVPVVQSSYVNYGKFKTQEEIDEEIEDERLIEQYSIYAEEQNHNDFMREHGFDRY